jgi:ubiquinone/menaquinone biosynthesis C-methylase UbiE
MAQARRPSTTGLGRVTVVLAAGSFLTSSKSPRRTTMNAPPRPAWKAFVSLLAAFAFGAGPAYAQEESVRPGINKPYENPDINESVKRFESENREVFSKRKEIVAACRLQPGMAVADVGAGTGLFTRLFAAEVGPQGRVYAVDIARKFIEHVEKTAKEAGRNNVAGIVGTPTSTGLPPDSVDLVFLCDTYHHFEYPQKTMDSIHRALRPGGRLVLVDYRRIEGKTPDWLLKHLRAGQEVFTAEIEAAGFKVVDRPDFLKDNYLVRFEKAGPPHKAWLESWQKENPTWRALHLIGPSPERLDVTERFVADVLRPMGFNVLILEVDYGFEFKSRPELQCHGITKPQARRLSEVCRQNGIRLIPLFNCLGHQSWAENTGALLKKHPEFDETPHVPPDNKGIYCREWCPSNPEVNPVVFALLDEMLDAFEADALHVGMDEVFLIGNDKCPRCKGKDVGELFAGVVNALHQHLVKEKGVEMLMWSDRLLDSGKFSYGTWEASRTGSCRALPRIPKDIILCDWHYEPRADYPSVRFFQRQGFRVLPSTWKNPDAAVALIHCARKDATQRMLGILFAGWSAGGNGEHLMAALQGGKADAHDPVAARQIAAAIQAGLKELAGPPQASPGGNGRAATPP